FYTDEDFHPDGPIGDDLRRNPRIPGGNLFKGGGAPRFLEFLVDEVRPALASKYRMDADDHCLQGYSAGGWFVVYTMFSRPGAFAKHLAGGPALQYCNGRLFEIEAQYASEHDNLIADLFIGIGELEMTEHHYLVCLSSTVRMVELLS